MKRGDIQMTSTGTGVSHSEYNARSDKEVHFLQIWAKPNKSGLKPNYYGRHFTDEEKTNKIVRVVAPLEDDNVHLERDAKGPVPVHADIRVSASILEPKNTIEHTSAERTNKTLVHNIMRSGYRKPKSQPISGGAKLSISNGKETVELEEGDSVFIDGKLDAPLKFESTGPKNAEFLIFEMF
jgi:redox-sensitive bicupin YhaK (pirin superfamily)